MKNILNKIKRQKIYFSICFSSKIPTMFQNTLMIIKPDYLVKRKILLLLLMQKGFFIKGQRKIYFTPELAAEFYEDRTEDGNFMFQVILLTKGNSEAFILAKDHAVKELIDVMVCYFGSLSEMEERIHVTQCQNKVQREISFIFPNYIHEPILLPEQGEFCSKNSLIETIVNTLYDIVTNPEKETQKSWKEKLCESLISTNRALPSITNQCCHNLELNMQDIAQQTEISCLNAEVKNENILEKNLSSDLSKDCSSLNFTTSSCVSCSGFDSGEVCLQQTYQQPLEEIIKARTIPLELPRQFATSILNAEKENVLEKLIVEEQIAEKELYNNLAGQEEDHDVFEINALNEKDILLQNVNSFKKDDVAFDDLLNSKQPKSVNGFLAKENIESNEIVLPDCEENKEIDFVEEPDEE